MIAPNWNLSAAALDARIAGHVSGLACTQHYKMSALDQQVKAANDKEASLEAELQRLDEVSEQLKSYEVSIPDMEAKIAQVRVRLEKMKAWKSIPIPEGFGETIKKLELEASESLIKANNDLVTLENRLANLYTERSDILADDLDPRTALARTQRSLEVAKAATLDAVERKNKMKIWYQHVAAVPTLDNLSNESPLLSGSRRESSHMTPD